MRSACDFCEQVGVDVREISEGIGLDHRTTLIFARRAGLRRLVLSEDVAALISQFREHGALGRGFCGPPKGSTPSAAGGFSSWCGKACLSWKAPPWRCGGCPSSPIPTTCWTRLPRHRACAAGKGHPGARVRPGGGRRGGRGVSRSLRGRVPIDAAGSGVSVVLVLTEWSEFRHVDLAHVKQVMARPVVIDGRRMFSPDEVHKSGLEYRAPGRGGLP